MISVAFVVHTFDMGGLERCVARLANHLDRSRFRVLVVCLDRNGSAASWLEGSGTRVVELGKRDGNDPRLVWRLAKVLREYEVDVVHSHNWGTLVETALARRFACRSLHVHAERGTVLGTLSPHGLRARLRGRAVRWAARQANAIVAVSSSVRRRLAAVCGVEETRVRVIENGVDVPPAGDKAQRRRDLRASLGLADDAVVFGSVGRLHDVKGFDVAVKALALVSAAGIDAHLVLVGDGGELGHLKALAHELGLDRRLHLAGAQKEVGAWLAAMDVYFNSSRSEGMSQAVLEAMGSRLPLVVTDVGEHAAVAGGEPPCGLVVPPERPEGLSSAFLTLAGSPEIRSELAERAVKRHRELYSVERMVRRYEELYVDLVAKSPVLRTEAIA